MQPISHSGAQSYAGEPPLTTTTSGSAPSAPSDELSPELEAELAKTEPWIEGSGIEAQSTEAPTNAGMPTYLTPESLVAYCDTRLSSLDSQMQAIFNQQQQSAAAETALSSLASDLNDLPQPASGGSGSTVEVTVSQFDNLQAAYQAAINAAGPNTALGQQLLADSATLASAYPVSEFATGSQAQQAYPLDESTITNLSQNVKTYASNLNSDSQMSMINLQSMMSQEQTAVQLSTNLLQSLSQTQQNIAANMKEG